VINAALFCQKEEATVSSTRLESLKELLTQEPNDSFIHYGLANEYYKLGQFEECIAHIDAYLKVADDEGAVYRMLGHSLLKLGRPAEARAAFERGIAAAERHHHPTMAEEFRETIEFEID
jgi:tetratricopeptide (TPR) repeat protein